MRTASRVRWRGAASTPRASIPTARQADRTAALEAFRRGDCSVLVATDVAGRGLDISGISHVINFDVPRCPDDYIHRAGRTARAGATGQVMTFIAPDEESIVGEIQAELGIELPRTALPDSVARLCATERAPVAGRHNRHRDHRSAAHGPSGRPSDRAVPVTPVAAPTSALAPGAAAVRGAGGSRSMSAPLPMP